MTRPSETDDADALVELEASARAEVVIPADAHVIGEPVTVTQLRYSGVARAGLLATCKRGHATYELSLVDVVFPAASPGASTFWRIGRAVDAHGGREGTHAWRRGRGAEGDLRALSERGTETGQQVMLNVDRGRGGVRVRGERG